MKYALQFGAGNIGRGFIGSILSMAGYAVIFVDISRVIIPKIQKEHAYTIEIVGSTKVEQTVSPVDGCFSDDPGLSQRIAEAEVITTAVGPNILPFIAPQIAAGIRFRKEEGITSPLHIIACENMIQGSTALRNEVMKLVDAETCEYIEKYVGFPDSAVDRIVPPMPPTEDLLRVRVEEFSEWIVDQRGFVGPIPQIEGMQLTDNLPAYLERKLFTLNTGHAITAYLGIQRGYHTIEESITDESIQTIVRGAMRESGEVLILRYGFDQYAHDAYIEKIIRRFMNPWLKDDLLRVGRQPLRKLSYDDRLIKPLRGTLEYGLPHINLILGIAAALRFRSEDDAQAVRLRELLQGSDLHGALREITSLENDLVLDAIAEVYQAQAQ